MASTMHFGPEWMRTKHQATSRPQPPPSPPPMNSHTAPNASTYSALVSPAPPPEPEKRDETHPFRYSKEELLQIYREGGGKGGLGLEVERWEGVVREVGSEPIGLREMSDAEKKLFAGPLNSEIRRRQSTDYLSSISTQPLGGERTRFNHNNPGPGSPMRERFGSLMGRRRESTDPPPLAIPRKQSLSSGQGPPASPRDITLTSPRTRIGGFDGVLSGGDSWIARRKAAEGLSKTTGASRGDAVGELDSKAAEIIEEGQSSDIAATAHLEDKPESNQQSTPQHLNPSSTDNETIKELEFQTTNMAISGLPSDRGIPDVSLGEAAAAAPAHGSTPTVPNETDLANVEWSYLDPQGNVQGPFLAHIMQTWHEAGYFTPDLLIRRTHVDKDWVAVGELARRTSGSKLFLSLPIVSTAPPGLSRHTESPMQNFASEQDQNVYSAPYQPVPARPLRPSTLDLCLTSSNPSDSPSSSFGAGRFSNGSPDPAAFGGRVGNNLYPGDGGRMQGFPAGYGHTNRGAFNEQSLEPSLGIHSGTFGNIAPGRASSVDNYGFNGYNTTQTPWPSNIISTPGQGFNTTGAGRTTADSLGPFSSSFDPSRPNFHPGSTATASQFGNRGPQDATFSDSSASRASFPLSDYNSLGASHANQQQSKQSINDDGLAQQPNLGFNDFANGVGNAAFVAQEQQYPQTPSLHYGTAPHHSAIPLQANTLPIHIQTINVPQQSPWDNADSRRPGPFDVGHPTATNTVVKSSVTPSQPSPWGRSQSSQSASQANEASPWFSASHQGAVDESWRETPGPNSLTFDNVGAHNQRHDTPASDLPTGTADAPVMPQLTSLTQPSPLATEERSLPSVPAPPIAIAPPVAPKSKRKSSAQQNQTVVAAPKTQPLMPLIVRNPSPPPPTQSKPAWSTEEDIRKLKPSGAGLGLREIQEAEAKKMEARKVSERERERAARVAALASASSIEDTQPFVASWGLPTSRAGTRNDSSPKESSTASIISPPTNTHVWTNTGKPPQTKKSMKEIQEEEERQKKLAVRETTATAAARRGYAESTNKITPSSQSGGGVWTTVGATGKASVTSPPTVRTSITPSTSTLSTTGSPSSAWTNGPTASRPTAAPKFVPPRADEPPAAPSHEFLKWLSESLKGLNNAVNLEDITSMLLSFPVDPDSSTLEIISDLIYANSTTLDGRRFTSDFVSKRKADITSKRSMAAVGKPVSIADVVKTQPKPTQPEWGGFKVVNKKKKGGR